MSILTRLRARKARTTQPRPVQPTPGRLPLGTRELPPTTGWVPEYLTPDERYAQQADHAAYRTQGGTKW